MYSNNYYKSIVIMGGLGAQPQRAEIAFLRAKLLKWTKKLGLILGKKGLFRNLALFECFLRNFREA